MREPVDVEAAARAVFDLLVALGEDPTSEELVATPARVARDLAALLAPASAPPTTFVTDVQYDELVVVRDLAFRSVCADHLAPFGGVVHVAYEPDTTIVGLSRLARVVDRCARRLQTEARLTVAIAEELDEELAPKGLGVVVETTRPCAALDGSGETGAFARTVALRGRLREDPAARAEFVRLTRGHRPER